VLVRQRSSSQTLVDALVAALGPGPWPLDAVLAHGWSYARIRAAVSAGRLVRPHRGVLAPGPDRHPRVGPPLASIADHERAGRAALLVAGEGAALSHESAASMHGLWLPEPRTELVHVRVPGADRRTDHGMRVHSSPLEEDEVCLVRGVRVTSVVRTAIDLARGRPLAEALVPLDSAARLLVGGDVWTLRSTEPDSPRVVAVLRELRQSLRRVRGWPGTARVWRALELVDPRSESPFESRSRGWIHEAGLPAPRVALPVRGVSGTEYYADFGWEAARVLGEADGFGKYGADQGEVRAALRAERRRQRDLEDAGWTVARWDTSEGRRTMQARLGRLLR
jgi:hypothetical protein